MTGQRGDGADVCIVGSGPAGAIPAALLAERGHDVVVLEAGPRFEMDERRQLMEMGLRPEYEHEDLWQMGGPRDAFTWRGDRSVDLNTHRIKAVGGTTLHWGGVSPRLHPEDFEMQSRYGLADDWPITYEDLQPYYARAETEMGVSGEEYPFSGPRRTDYPLPAFPPSYSDGLFESACSALDIELHAVPRAMNSEPYDDRSPCIGYGTCQIVCPSGGKYDASVHARKTEQQGGRVISQAPVRRLELDEAGDRVTAAVYSTPSGEERRVEASHFVVACGAVESARLLLLSGGERYPAGIANSSGEVGRGLANHVGMTLTGELDEPTRQHLIGFSTRMTEQFYDRDSGPEGSFIIKLSNTAGTPPATAATAQSPNVAKLVNGNLDGVLGEIDLGDEFVDTYRDRSDNLVGLTTWVEQLPSRDNRVTLDEATEDDWGNPAPEIRWELDRRTKRSLRNAAQVCREILTQMGAQNVRTVGTPESPILLSHRTGTTRMGTDPAESVVNPQLRTHDLSNLYVSSGGTFVTAGAANPTLTIVALGVRLADHLHERLSGGA
jgi:choline dehydrogenase-like flavoprotein